MNKIKNYMLVLLLMVIGCFFSGFESVKAEQTQEELEYLSYFVFNPNSEGNPTYVFDFDIKDEQTGDVTGTITKQFTASREIAVLLKFPADKLSNVHHYEVCEKIPGNGVGAANRENCVSFPTTDTVVRYQIVSMNDGEKTIGVYLKSENGGNVITGYSKTIILDTTGPIINITGGEYVFIPKGQKYVEKGATCVDDSEYSTGECTVTVENANIDLNKEGYQYVRYTAVDHFGNEVNVVKKVLADTKVEESNNKALVWVGSGIFVAIVAAFVLLIAWQNKEKQKNQSVL